MRDCGAGLGPAAALLQHHPIIPGATGREGGGVDVAGDSLGAGHAAGQEIPVRHVRAAQDGEDGAGAAGPFQFDTPGRARRNFEVQELGAGQRIGADAGLGAIRRAVGVGVGLVGPRAVAARIGRGRRILDPCGFLQVGQTVGVGVGENGDARMGTGLK